MAFSLFGKQTAEPETPEPAEGSAGFFSKMRQAVTRTRESIHDRIDTVLSFTREVDESDLAALEAILLSADIGSATTTEIIEKLRQRALRQKIEGGTELKQLLKAELIAVLNSAQPPSNTGNSAAQTRENPVTGTEVIMMVGVNGTGKTTTSGKLAAHFTAQGKSVLLCAADTFRAAAIEQLTVWAERSNVAIIKTKQGGDPSAALYDAATAAKARSTDILLVDTAGRLHTKSNLMSELDKMCRTAQKLIPGAPHQTLLVMDATTGQNGLMQARLFAEAAAVTGIVLTKLDGTAKGGIVIAIARELGLPVRYVGVGEKMADLLPFDSTAFVDSLLDG
jgi:fused signal recognition particle receptor